MVTELARIAELPQEVRQEPTPLQRRLDGLAKVLALVAVGIAVVVVLSGLARGEDAGLVLLTGVSLAVAIVPEGLPAVLTFTLALAARRMLGRRALIRRLPAVETLGSVTVICSDNTGALTQNRMTVTRLQAPAGRVRLGEDGPAGDVAAVAPLAAAGALCNDAVLAPDGAGALRAVAEQASRRGGFVPHVEVDPAVGGRSRDELLFSVGRELITNVAKHASADHLWIAVRLRGGEVELEVRDDGVGVDLAALEATPVTGHLGLASCAERVEAVGGRLVVEGAPGEGTRVRALVPALPASPLHTQLH